MEIEAEHLFSFLAAVIASLLTYAGARVQATSKEQSASQKSTDGKMQSMSDHLVKMMVKGFAKRDEVIADMNVRLVALERKDAAWLQHVMDWRRNYPDRSRWPTPPLEVRGDLPD